jgi:hypothetical protein
LTTAQAVREILLSIALLVGGVWALYRYWYLESPHAQLDFKRQEAQIGLTSYLNIDMTHRLRADGDAFDVIGEIRIENPGNKAVLLDFRGTKPIRVSKLQPGADGQYEALGNPLLLPILFSEPINDLALEGKGRGSLKFVARLKEPGLYSVEFWSKSPGTAGLWASYIIIDVSAAARAEAEARESR